MSCRAGYGRVAVGVVWVLAAVGCGSSSGGVPSTPPPPAPVSTTAHTTATTAPATTVPATTSTTAPVTTVAVTTSTTAAAGPVGKGRKKAVAQTMPATVGSLKKVSEGTPAGKTVATASYGPSPAAPFPILNLAIVADPVDVTAPSVVVVQPSETRRVGDAYCETVLGQRRCRVQLEGGYLEVTDPLVQFSLARMATAANDGYRALK